MRPPATCRTSSWRPTSTSVPTSTAARTRTAPASRLRWLTLLWRRLGPAVALAFGSRHSVRCPPLYILASVHSLTVRFVGDFQGIDISNPFGDFKYITEQIDSKGLAYVHIVEPRSDLMGPVEEKIVEMMAAARARGIIPEDQLHDQLTTVKPFRKLLKKTPLITCGFTDKNYNASLDAGEIDAAVFGRHYISNPDLPERLRNGWPLAPYDRQYFYARGPAGYIDYPTYQQQQAAAAKN